MSELKDYDIMDIEAMDDERLEKSESGKIQVTRVYIKSDVDAAIAELKFALKESEEARYEAGADAADYYQETRRLKRALWLARAYRAIMTLDYFTLKCKWFKDYMKVEPPKCDVKMITKWANVERKCRAKAEEY